MQGNAYIPRLPKIETISAFCDACETVIGRRPSNYVEAVRADSQLRKNKIAFTPYSLLRHWYRATLPASAH